MNIHENISLKKSQILLLITKTEIYAHPPNLGVYMNIFRPLPQVQFHFNFGSTLVWDDFTIRSKKHESPPDDDFSDILLN